MITPQIIANAIRLLGHEDFIRFITKRGWTPRRGTDSLAIFEKGGEWKRPLQVCIRPDFLDYHDYMYQTSFPSLAKELRRSVWDAIQAVVGDGENWEGQWTDLWDHWPPTCGTVLFRDDTHRIAVIHGNMENVLAALPWGLASAVIADPPYYLSRKGGTTCSGGKRVSVSKGVWDTPPDTLEENFARTMYWMQASRMALRTDGSMWTFGSMHNLPMVGLATQALHMKPLNQVVWEKPAPPPNLSCRFLTHSWEGITWCSKAVGAKYVFNYDAMREENGGKQLKDVWRFGRPSTSERTGHPAQKPVDLVTRLIRASTPLGGLVIDPFLGSGTTAMACLKEGRACIGIEIDRNYADMATDRLRAAVEAKS